MLTQMDYWKSVWTTTINDVHGDNPQPQHPRSQAPAAPRQGSVWNLWGLIKR